MKIQTFDFNESAVRVVEREGEPWFVAADVCRVLDLTNVTEATRSLDADELDSVILNSGGQGRKAVLITESGLYALIFKSRKREAKVFRKWVTAEVLPQIRRTGKFTPASDMAAMAGEAGDGLLTVLDFLRLKLAALPPGTVLWSDVLSLGRAVQVAERDLGVTGAVRPQADGSRMRAFSPVLLETVWAVELEPVFARRQPAATIESLTAGESPAPAVAA